MTDRGNNDWSTALQPLASGTTGLGGRQTETSAAPRNLWDDAAALQHRRIPTLHANTRQQPPCSLVSSIDSPYSYNIDYAVAPRTASGALPRAIHDSSGGSVELPRVRACRGAYALHEQSYSLLQTRQPERPASVRSSASSNTPGLGAINYTALNRSRTRSPPTGTRPSSLVAQTQRDDFMERYRPATDRLQNYGYNGSRAIEILRTYLGTVNTSHYTPSGPTSSSRASTGPDASSASPNAENVHQPQNASAGASEPSPSTRSRPSSQGTLRAVEQRRLFYERQQTAALSEGGSTDDETVTSSPRSAPLSHSSFASEAKGEEKHNPVVDLASQLSHIGLAAGDTSTRRTKRETTKKEPLAEDSSPSADRTQPPASPLPRVADKFPVTTGSNGGFDNEDALQGSPTAKSSTTNGTAGSSSYSNTANQSLSRPSTNPSRANGTSSDKPNHAGEDHPDDSNQDSSSGRGKPNPAGEEHPDNSGHGAGPRVATGQSKENLFYCPFHFSRNHACTYQGRLNELIIRHLHSKHQKIKYCEKCKRTTCPMFAVANHKKKCIKRCLSCASVPGTGKYECQHRLESSSRLRWQCMFQVLFPREELPPWHEVYGPRIRDATTQERCRLTSENSFNLTHETYPQHTPTNFDQQFVTLQQLATEGTSMIGDHAHHQAFPLQPLSQSNSFVANGCAAPAGQISPSFTDANFWDSFDPVAEDSEAERRDSGSARFQSSHGCGQFSTFAPVVDITGLVDSVLSQPADPELRDAALRWRSLHELFVKAQQVLKEAENNVMSRWQAQGSEWQSNGNGEQ